MQAKQPLLPRFVPAWLLHPANPAPDASGTTIPAPLPRSVNPCPTGIINVSLDRDGHLRCTNGGDTESPNPLQDRCEQLMRHRDFGRLERHVLGVPNDFRTDLNQLLAQRGQRPVLHRPR